MGEDDMATVIYGKFSDQIFRDPAQVEDWSELPLTLQHYASVWRDGADLRAWVASRRICLATYYKVRKGLLAHGIDIATPCTVLALTRRIRVIEIVPVSALREAA